MKKPTIIGRLDHNETTRLEKEIERAVDILRASGLGNKTIKKRLQTELWDVFLRLSMACPYERLRCQLWCKKHLPPAFQNGDHLFFVTFGRPQDRVPVGSLKSFRLDNLNRHFRRAIAKLKAMGVKNLKVFAVVEIQLVKPLDGPPYWEPHLHLIVSGATAEQLSRAFKVRKPAATTCRKQPLQIKPIWGLDGLISYCLKFHPKVQVQYRTDAGLNWWPNRLLSAYLPEWYRFMSRHSPGEMLKFVEINGEELSQPLTAELYLDLSGIPRGRL
jgi:hypothetical protein